MSKFERYVLVFLLSFLCVSCSVAIFYQNRTKGSSQVQTTPLELRSDSSHYQFDLDFNK